MYTLNLSFLSLIILVFVVLTVKDPFGVGMAREKVE
jgi:hypothetical protein